MLIQRRIANRSKIVFPAEGHWFGTKSFLNSRPKWSLIRGKVCLEFQSKMAINSGQLIGVLHTAIAFFFLALTIHNFNHSEFSKSMTEIFFFPKKKEGDKHLHKTRLYRVLQATFPQVYFRIKVWYSDDTGIILFLVLWCIPWDTKTPTIFHSNPIMKLTEIIFLRHANFP